jgi:drug/metabolite transporter (DMT)-like permease
VFSFSPRVLALATTVVLWASAFPAIRVAVDGLGVAGLSFLRLAVASLALALVSPLLGVPMPRVRDLPHIALCGLTGMSAYQLLLNWGEVHVPAGPASLIVVTAPVFSVLLATAFLGEVLTRRVLLGSGIAIAGAGVIAFAGGSAQVSTSALVVLAAAFVQGVYHFSTKPLLRRYTGFQVACYAMWSGTFFLLPLAPAAAHAFSAASPKALGAVVFLGLLPSAVAFVTWGYAVARYPVAVSTAALYLVPPVALFVAYVWLGETPRPVELLGGLVTIVGVFLINRRPVPIPTAKMESATTSWDDRYTGDESGTNATGGAFAQLPAPRGRCEHKEGPAVHRHRVCGVLPSQGPHQRCPQCQQPDGQAGRRG